MTDHITTRRIQRQRERKARHISETAAVAAYNRDGVSAACEALGAGSADDWGDDGAEGGMGHQAGENGGAGG